MTDEKMIRVSKKCPECGWRLFDKVSPANGYIEIKCGRCGAMVTVNLALRRTIKYRMAKAPFDFAS